MMSVLDLEGETGSSLFFFLVFLFVCLDTCNLLCVCVCVCLVMYVYVWERGFSFCGR